MTNMSDRQLAERWEMPTVSARLGSHPAASPAGEAETIRREAAARGFAQGRRQGLEAGRKDGWRAGRDQGYAEGLRAGTEQAERQAARHLDMMQRLSADTATLIEQGNTCLGNALVDLAMTIARQVVGWSGVATPPGLVQAVRGTLKDLGNATHIVVRVHPAALSAIKAGVGHTHGAETAVSFEADETLEAHDYLIASDATEIDARLRTRWEAACKSLGITPAEDLSGEPNDT
ncbi:MAG: hypothetical protein EPN41_02270 [Candidimonas sp.]|nr:MAG: hypothetical protein EPN41_02270 [Candidimonas sp.]